MIDQFSKWMQSSTQLSNSSIYKYTRAVCTTSKDMQNIGVIEKELLVMNQFELDIAIERIFNNEEFKVKNITGRRMYSNSLKQFRCFVANTQQIIDTVMCSDELTTEYITSIRMRVGQSTYRRNLIQKYEGRCPITGITQQNVLIASHIKPWSVCKDIERIDVENGLLLSANIDKLFDSGLVTFNKHGRIYVSSFINSENREKLGIVDSLIFDLKMTHDMSNYLEYHQDIVYVK